MNAPNPARILIQRVLVDLVPPNAPLPADDDAIEHVGLLQTFETRITLACSDPADDRPACAWTEEHSDEPAHTTAEALEEIAAYHYGATGRTAVRDAIRALERM